MGLDVWIKLFALVQSLITIVAIAVGGAWAYAKFIYRREKEPRAEFTVDLDFVGTQGNSWLVEVSASVENKGLVRHPVKDFKLTLRYLCEDDPIRDGDEKVKFQVVFPHLINERIENQERFLWKDTYIDPGLRYRNSYITFLPLKATFVLLQGKFVYGKEPFTAQKLLKVPDSKNSLVSEAKMSSTE
jgi:hypothetical protein